MALATVFIELPEHVQNLYDEFVARWGDVVFTGSRAIGCAKANSDWDFVVADDFPINLDEFRQRITDDESSITEAMIANGHPLDFTSIRIGDVNLIVDHRGKEQLERWMVATDFCNENCVYDKPARICIFNEFMGYKQ